MMSIKQVLVDIVVISALVLVVIYLYKAYGSQVYLQLFDEQRETIFIGNLSLSVLLADTDEERKKGLSGVKSLRALEGTLLMFDREDYYGIWMKDMRFPIDILWINEDFVIVHIEEDVEPDTYPTSFTSDEPARFVLEMNSFFTESYKIKEGDRVTIPVAALSEDLRKSLQK